MFATSQDAGRPTSKVPTLKLIFALTQGRSLLPAAGTAVTRSSQGQMNCLATAGLTRERRSLCVLCVTGASCGVTT